MPGNRDNYVLHMKIDYKVQSVSDIGEGVLRLSNEEGTKQLLKGLLFGMQEGTVAVPHLLLKYYHKLQISELEVMLLIQLIAFKEKEHKDFPTIEEIQLRMTAAPELIIKAIQKLMKNQLITIDDEIDPISGIQYEKYNLLPVLEKIASCWYEDIQPVEPAAAAAEPGKEGKDIFSIFEKEFARPLSPMECETISSWLDRDNYSMELILAALKEAVFAGKVHFRYIDRILLEWSRNRVFTVEQAREYTQKFRGAR